MYDFKITYLNLIQQFNYLYCTCRIDNNIDNTIILIEKQYTINEQLDYSVLMNESIEDIYNFYNITTDSSKVELITEGII